MSIKKTLDQFTESTSSAELIDDDFFEGDGIISDAFDEAIEAVEIKKTERTSLMKKKASDKRKSKNQTKKELGIRTAKQSKFNTRSHQFLGESGADRAIHVDPYAAHHSVCQVDDTHESQWLQSRHPPRQKPRSRRRAI